MKDLLAPSQDDTDLTAASNEKVLHWMTNIKGIKEVNLLVKASALEARIHSECMWPIHSYHQK